MVSLQQQNQHYCYATDYTFLDISTRIEELGWIVC